ncbi:SIS domain-containing protein, partial [Staphylococcus aureus]|uniref:SIS domain-containing protein n=1 Tax=Staphylococcus aureus TaxID=1280 RepID=UPI002181E22F
VTNVAGSTLSREADHTLLLHAGPEIAVASTKAYTAQIAVLSILSQVVAQAHGRDNDIDLLRVTNVAGSTLSREADHTLLLHAGPEIAVASTKA